MPRPKLHHFSPYLLLLPFFACFLLFWLAPLFGAIHTSLHSNSLVEESSFVGLKNFIKLFGNERYFKALSNTIIYTVGSIVVIIPAAVFLAHLIRATFPRVRPYLTFLLLLPGLTPPTALAILFRLVFDGEQGLINRTVITPLGLDWIRWLTDPNFIMPALIMQSAWRWTGFITFFVLAGMETIPKVLYETTSLVTNSRWHQFCHVTLPLLKQVLLFSTIYLVIDAFSLFAGSYVLIGSSGGTLDAGLLLVSFTYEHFDEGRFGTAAAISSSVAPLLLFLLWYCFNRGRRTGS